jgi:HD-GYP domain-containing protein (c-di-GMP phosphodiesterase class II)
MGAGRMQTITELRVSVRGLSRGMFVSRLDRPWIESPFPLEGLELRTEEEIESLRRICSYVFVDTSRGTAPDLRFIEHGTSELVTSARGRDEFIALQKVDWEIQSDFEAERAVASEVHGRLEREIDEVMTDLKNGRNLDMGKLKDGVEAMVDSILRNPAAFTWIKEMKRRDDYSYHHALGCAIWAASFGRHLGLEKEEVQKLALGGLLCDVGMTRLPPELLGRQGSLSGDEAGKVREHVAIGLEILARTPDISPKILEIVATHHERHDGSGYPHGIKGELIPIYGRIMGLVDSYNAMTCVRPHAPTRSAHNAVSELYGLRGTLFQAELVEQFIQTCGIYPTGTLVELSNGEVGVVVSVHSLKRLRPSVMLLLDRKKVPFAQFRTIDLAETEHDEAGEPLNVKGGLPAGAFNINLEELFLD